MKKVPAYSMARSVLEYDDFSKQLILAYKHGDRTDLTPILIKFLLQAESVIFQDVDVIIPVPLHWTRFLKRRYNQSSLLGKALGKKLKIPFSSNLLKRVRMTESQGTKNRRAREKNIKNAFRVPNPDAVRGMKILLIDDVMTTGATLQECAKTLKKAGAKDIKVITLYRVIRL
ncbi:MAG: ComF family protein [Alphaproteobacteria bacterium]|nr:ComF family protein [Alphaproteobacteria bacterium]